jgi:hypothetical protein
MASCAQTALHAKVQNKTVALRRKKISVFIVVILFLLLGRMLPA